MRRLQGGGRRFDDGPGPIRAYAPVGRGATARTPAPFGSLTASADAGRERHTVAAGTGASRAGRAAGRRPRSRCRGQPLGPREPAATPARTRAGRTDDSATAVVSREPRRYAPLPTHASA